MNRRGFLSSLAVAAAALVIDPEKLLWVPGAKKMFVPPASGWIQSAYPTPDRLGELMDWQRLYNYYMSTQAELLAAPPYVVYTCDGDPSTAVVMPPTTIAVEMQASMNEFMRLVPKDPITVRRSELSSRDIAFLCGEQWPRDIKEQRALARQPMLIVNRMLQFVTVVDDVPREMW